MTSVRPLTVVNCFAFPLLSLTFVVSFPTPAVVIRMTWLAMNSSEFTSSVYGEFESRSREFRSTSVVGTRRICQGILITYAALAAYVVCNSHNSGLGCTVRGQRCGRRHARRGLTGASKQPWVALAVLINPHLNGICVVWIALRCPGRDKCSSRVVADCGIRRYWRAEPRITSRLQLMLSCRACYR